MHNPMHYSEFLVLQTMEVAKLILHNYNSSAIYITYITQMQTGQQQIKKHKGQISTCAKRYG